VAKIHGSYDRIVIQAEQHGQTKPRRVKRGISNYTELLGENLIKAGFTLCSDGHVEVLARYYDRWVKHYPTGKYSLKTIKRYCRLYLQHQASK